MLKNSNPISNKSKSWLFWLIFIAVIASLFCLALFVLAPNSQIAVNTLVELGNNIVKGLVTFLLVGIFTLFFSSIYFKFILGIPLSGIKAEFKKDGNDSHSIIIGGIAISSAIAFIMANGANIRQYLYEICTKAIPGFLLALIATLILTRVMGVKSIKEYRSWIDRPNNDSYAIYVSVILITSLLIFMS